MKKERSKLIADKLTTFGRQAKQGGTFGFADELQDVIGAGIAYPFTDQSYGELLSQARDMSRQELSKDWKDSPVTSMAGQITGGIPFGLTRGAAKAANWIRSGSKIKGIGKSAALGAGLGAVSGVGGADDTFDDRLSGGVVGAAIGGILGGATAPLSRLGIPSDQVDYRKVIENVSERFSNKAQKELAKQLSARPDLADQLKRAEQMSLASQNTGIPLTTAEMIAQSSSDPLLAQQAVIGGNPMTSGRMESFYAARSGTPQKSGQIEQSLTALAKQLDPNVGSYDEAAQSLISRADKAQREITGRFVEEAKPFYDKAYSMTLDPKDAILKNPLIQNALNRAKNNPVFAQEIANLPNNSIQTLDVVKRSLDDMAENASRQGNRNEARLIQSAKEKLLSSMDEATKVDGKSVYKQARSVYSGNPEALQMRETIGGLADIDPMDAKSVNRALFNGTQQNANLTAKTLSLPIEGTVGPQNPYTVAAARIYDAMDSARGDPVTLANRIAPDQRTTDMMRMYSGGNAGQLDDTLNVINQAKLGERMRYGSPTQPRMEAEKSLAGAAADTALDAVTGNKIGMLRKIGQMFGRGSEETDPQFYADMADLMLTDKGMDLVRQVASGQQGAIQQIQRIGLPSLITGSAARTGVQPFAQAAIGGIVTPQYQSPVFENQGFADIEAILNQPRQQNQDFSDIEAILKGVR